VIFCVFHCGWHFYIREVNDGVDVRSKAVWELAFGVFLEDKTVVEVRNAVAEVRNAVVEVRNAVVEVRNAVAEVRNVVVEVRKGLDAVAYAVIEVNTYRLRPGNACHWRKVYFC